MTVIIISEISFQNQLESFFKNFEKKHKLNFKKMFFSNDKSFLSQQKNLNFDLLFLLHSVKNIFLFNIAEKIKEEKPSCKVIFSSPSSEFAVMGYRIGLDFFLIHPFTYEDFDFAMNKILKNHKKQKEYIFIKSGWQKIPIEISKIQFVEKIDHNVIIHTQEKNFSTRSTLTKFINNFKNMNNFVHCVRGAIVNLAWVQNLESQNFLMKTGERISIRRNDRKKIKQIYNNFLTLNKNENLE